MIDDLRDAIDQEGGPVLTALKIALVIAFLAALAWGIPIAGAAFGLTP